MSLFICRRVASVSLGRAMAVTAPRLVAKNDEVEDDRWLEAMFHDKEKAPEERYADQKQREVLKKLVTKMRGEHQNHVETVVTEHARKHDEKVDFLKKQIQDLNTKLEQAQKE